MHRMWIVIRPTMNDVRVAQISSCGRVWFFIVSMFAPRTMGMTIRNENLIAVFSFSPRRSPVEIVEPDREIPGKREMI